METHTSFVKYILVVIIYFIGAGLTAQTVYTVNSELDSGIGTLRQLISDAATNDSIVIPVNYTIVLSSEIAFSKSLKINGQGSTIQVSEPGMSNSRVFMLGSTSSVATKVSLYNLILLGGDLSSTATNYGATVYVNLNHNFTMRNCTVSKGKASYCGGLFFKDAVGTTVNIDNCTFSENESTTANGGACILKGNITVNNSTYINNKAVMNGAAISCYSGALISKCRFIDNTSLGTTAGAVINYSTTGGPVNFENCTFESNTLTNANSGAGAFAIAGATCSSTFTNCTFSNNSGRSAGAIYNAKGKLTLVNCTFVGNLTPSTKGGGFSNINHVDAKTTMINTIFAYNYNSAGLMDVFVSDPGTVDGTNNLLGIVSGTTAMTNPVSFDYSNSSLLFHNYTIVGNKIPIVGLDGIAKLAIGSVAIQAGIKNYGDPELVPQKDQRGNMRPTFPSVGAVEFIDPTFPEAQAFEHLIIYGQSLSTGHQSWPPLSVTAIDGNYMIGNQIWSNFGNTGLNKLYPLIANVAATTASLAKNRANMIYAENPLVAAANHIQLKTGGQYKFIATSTGTGGRTIEELSEEYYNPVFYKCFNDAISCALQMSSSIHCPALIWMQGEYNYTLPSGSNGLTAGSIPTSDKTAYKSLMVKLKNNMQADIMSSYNQQDKPLFITYQVGAQYSRGKELAIGMAQLEAANENSDIVCAGPVYPMTDRGGHLDSNGYRWFGEILGKVYYKTKFLGENFKPLQPLEISRTADLKKLKIKFLVPQLPLILDELTVNKTTSYGFELYVNGSKKDISNVAIEGDCVYLTSLSDLTGDVEVVYAGTSNTGHGNLRDSDSYPSYFNYVDLDKKNMSGAYVYERDYLETTLRPSYEPRDAKGVIYDKPYPQFNFCVAFYYKLNSGDNYFLVPNLSPNTDLNNTFTEENVKAYYSDNTLCLKTSASDIVRIDVYNMFGKIMASFRNEEMRPQTLNKLPLPLISDGCYLVKVSSLKNNYTTKIIVH